MISGRLFITLVSVFFLIGYAGPKFMSKSRSAEGGLLGVGGWATAGSGQMMKQLADWVAGDVLNAIKKGMKSK